MMNDLKSNKKRAYVLQHDFVRTFSMCSSSSLREIISAIEPPPRGEVIVLYDDHGEVTPLSS